MNCEDKQSQPGEEVSSQGAFVEMNEEKGNEVEHILESPPKSSRGRGRGK